MKYTSLLCLCLGIVLSGCTRQTPIADKSPDNEKEKTNLEVTKAPSKSIKKDPAKSQVKESQNSPDNKRSAQNKSLPELPKPPSAPPLAASFEAKMAQKALGFLETRWKSAREKGDTAGYAKLLTAEFKGSRTAPSPQPGIPNKTTPIQNRAEWISNLSTFMPGGQTISLGPASVDIVKGPATRATFRFPEREAVGDKCIIRDRELTVFLWEDRPPLLNNEIEQNASACPDTDSAHVASIHDQLKEHVAKYQPLDKYLNDSSFWLRDFGFQVGTFKGDYLQTDAGKWLLKILEESEADFDSTRYFGTVGTVRTKSNVTFVYAFQGDTWKLLGISRDG